MPSRIKSYIKLEKAITRLVNFDSNLRREINDKIAIIHRLEARNEDRRREIIDLDTEMAQSTTDDDLEKLNRFIKDNILDKTDLDSDS